MTALISSAVHRAKNVSPNDGKLSSDFGSYICGQNTFTYLKQLVDITIAVYSTEAIPTIRAL